MFNPKILMMISCLLPFITLAKDVVRINKGQDSHTQYKMIILQTALAVTEKKYGDYEVIINGPPTTIKRAIMEIKSGNTINAFMAVTTPAWEKNTLVIRIPVRRGILNYRLLSVHKNNLDKFANVHTLDDLKKLQGGVRIGWATTAVLKSHAFKLFEANTLRGLYHMLENNRVDYIPRGANEIYNELLLRKNSHPNLVVEPSLALYIPAPYYIFISPKEAKLAQRIEEGLELMIADGSLERIFYQHYADNIKRANLANRRIITIGNPFLPVETPLARKELWFENDPQMQSLELH